MTEETPQEERGLVDDTRKVFGRDLEARTRAGLAKDKGVRELVKEKFSDMGYPPHELFVEVIVDAYKAAKGEILGKDGKPISDSLVFKYRRMVAREMSAFLGLEAGVGAASRDGGVLMIVFPESFAEDGSATIEVGVRATSGPASPDPRNVDGEILGPDSGDSEREDPSGNLSDPLVGGEAGEEE